jgi:hypothetical protein
MTAKTNFKLKSVPAEWSQDLVAQEGQEKPAKKSVGLTVIAATTKAFTIQFGEDLKTFTKDDLLDSDIPTVGKYRMSIDGTGIVFKSSPVAATTKVKLGAGTKVPAARSSKFSSNFNSAL